MLQSDEILAAGKAAREAAANDSIPTLASELHALAGMSTDEIVNSLVSTLLEFAAHVALAVIVFYVGRFIIRKLHRLVGSVFTRRHLDQSLATFVMSLVNIVLYFILIVTVIGILGLETSSFLALFASAGVAVGLALSGTLQNFAGGVLILLLKPYKIGDYIEAQGYAGTVKEIGIFSTIINTGDNKQIIIPNGGLSTSSVNNYSKEEYRRVDWTLSLAYGDDAERAKAAILEVLRSDARVEAAAGREPFVALAALGPGSIDFTRHAWTRAANYWDLFFAVNERLYRELPARGFHFPFPQLDVHLNPQNP